LGLNVGSAAKDSEEGWLKPDFVKEVLGQTNKQQRHFNELPISEFHGAVYKLLFTHE
jgi:hypothetical protein